jgi:hypothetical protein
MDRYRRVVIVGVIVLALSTVAAAIARPRMQTPPAPAVISAEAKLQIQLAMQHLELLQTKVQVLQAEFDKTKADLQFQLKGLERPGYDLNLQTFEYVKKAPAK